MPTHGDLPGELRDAMDADDEPPRRDRRRRARILAVVVIVAMAAPAMVGVFRLLGLI